MVSSYCLPRYYNKQGVTIVGANAIVFYTMVCRAINYGFMLITSSISSWINRMGILSSSSITFAWCSGQSFQIFRIISIYGRYEAVTPNAISLCKGNASFLWTAKDNTDIKWRCPNVDDASLLNVCP